MMVFCFSDRCETNNTGSGCIDSCEGLTAGDYQSCKGCNVYASCNDGQIHYDERPCAADLVWDDNAKMCLYESTTCQDGCSGKRGQCCV